jgi:putative nucleotidyltransferase-like protein
MSAGVAVATRPFPHPWVSRRKAVLLELFSSSPPRNRLPIHVHYNGIATEKCLPPFESSSFQNEWPVLLECVSPQPDAQKLSALLPAVNGPRLLELAAEHGVLGHLAARLGKMDGHMLPRETRQALLDGQRAQNFVTLRMTAELFRVLDQFASAGIGALVVKGPVLAVRAYGNPAMRSYGDLDLLVRQRDVRRATELMVAADYYAAVPLAAIDAGRIPGQYLFARADSKLLVELHNDLTLRYFPRRLPLERFFERQARVQVDSREVPALSVEDELVLICVHGAKHLWERLMWIADVAALVSRRANLDWERAASSAKEVGAERMLHTGLQLAAALLKLRLPDHVLEKVKSDKVAANLASQILNWLPAAGYAPPGLFERAAFRMRMHGGLVSAPAYLIRLSLSPTEEDWGAGAEENQSSFLDVVRRPFRLARKYGRARKS